MRFDTWNILRNRLALELEKHGAVSEFSRKTGYSRAAVDKWLNGLSVPKVDTLDKFAEALDTKPWELIQPEHDKSKCEKMFSIFLIEQMSQLEEFQLEMIRENIKIMLDAFRAGPDEGPRRKKR